MSDKEAYTGSRFFQLIKGKLPLQLQLPYSRFQAQRRYCIGKGRSSP